MAFRGLFYNIVMFSDVTEDEVNEAVDEGLDLKLAGSQDLNETAAACQSNGDDAASSKNANATAAQRIGNHGDDVIEGNDTVYTLLLNFTFFTIRQNAVAKSHGNPAPYKAKSWVVWAPSQI